MKPHTIQSSRCVNGPHEKSTGFTPVPSWLRPLSLVLLISLPSHASGSKDLVCQANNYAPGGGMLLVHYVGPGGAVRLPDAIDGVPLTGIYPTAFRFVRELTRLHIPASVIDINGGTPTGNLGDTDLNGGPRGGTAGFLESLKLERITVDPGNPRFHSADGVLFDKSVTKLIYFPNARSGSYHLPADVRQIDCLAFRGCSHLEEITVEPSNTSFSSRDGVLYNKDQTVLLQCPQGKTGSINIPDGVTRIAEAAFFGCGKLAGVGIPATVTHIGSDAFYGCGGLSRMKLPDQIKTVGRSTFGECTGLLSIELPDGLADIGDAAFRGCAKLDHANLPASVVNIGSAAFQGCASLSQIRLPTDVARIGDQAFGECTGLTEVCMDPSNPNFRSMDGVLFDKAQTKIILCPAGYSGVFRIPATVESLQWRAFATCVKLTDFEVAEGNPVFSTINGVLFNHDGTKLIKYPRGRAGDYRIPDGVTIIGDAAFCDCGTLTGVTIPTSVNSIEDYAFGNCTGFTKLEIPASVKIRGHYAFYGCSAAAPPWKQSSKN